MTPAKRLIMMGMQYTNLLGTAGDCESIGVLGTGGTLDETEKMYGNASIRCGRAWNFYYDTTNLITNHVYFISAWVKTNSETQYPRIVPAFIEGYFGYAGNASNIWHRVGGVFAYVPNEDTSKNKIYFLLNETDDTNSAWFDGIMIIDLLSETETDVAALMAKYSFKNN